MVNWLTLNDLGVPLILESTILPTPTWKSPTLQLGMLWFQSLLTIWDQAEWSFHVHHPDLGIGDLPTLFCIKVMRMTTRIIFLMINNDHDDTWCSEADCRGKMVEDNFIAGVHWDRTSIRIPPGSCGSRSWVGRTSAVSHQQSFMVSQWDSSDGNEMCPARKLRVRNVRVW